MMVHRAVIDVFRSRWLAVIAVNAVHVIDLVPRFGHRVVHQSSARQGVQTCCGLRRASCHIMDAVADVVRKCGEQRCRC